MKKILFSLLLIIILWLIPEYGKAVTIQVPTDYKTIQSAIDNASDGSTIIVAPGTYSEALSFPNLNKTLYVKSSGGAASTIIHGGGIRDLLYIANASYGGKDLTFDGFTFTQGRDVTNISPVTIINASPVFLNCQFQNNSSVSSGGAVLVYAASNPTFINCQFLNNQSDRFGGAVLVNGPQAQASFKQCLFENNTANGSNISQGGALTFLSAGGTVLSCIFRRNSANYVGGAVRIIEQIYSNPSNRVTLSDCQFMDNFCLPGSSPPPTPTEGGAIHVEANVTVDIRKCYFSNNYAMFGGAVHNYRAQLSISDSVFDNNRAVGINHEGGGGAIAVNSYSPSPTNTLDATLTVKNSMIRNCLAPAGGGIFFQGDWGQNLTNSRRGQITLTNVVIDNCVATKANNSIGIGGALGLAFANLIGNGIYLLNNTAAQGGAIYAYQNTLINLTNSYIIGNSAPTGASLLVADPSTSPPPLLTNTIKAYNQGDDTANLAILMAVPTIPINGEAWLAYIIAPYAGGPSISPNIGVLAPNTGGYAAGTKFDPITSNTTYQLTSNQPTQHVQINVALTPTNGLAANDFNGDKRSDILWRNAVSGQIYIWLMEETSISSQSSPATVSDLNWEIKDVGDFNGDSKADILFRHAVTGQIYIWLMNGTSISSQASPATVSDLNWQIIGVGDFNGDGKADILWRHAVTGQIYIWLMNGTSISSQASPATVSDLNWQIIGVGDFNGDGKADILWRHAVTGQLYTWLMNGTSISSQASPGAVGDLNWQIEGIGDFDGDGKADILWRHASSGQLYIWLMNGTFVLFSDSPGFVSDPNWVIRSIGDFDGDGKADILLYHVMSGQISLWQMDGTSRIFPAPAGIVSDLNWKIK